MALRLRRGTDLERQAVIFAEGELVYTTDTKSLFVGDGQTLGGILISGDILESPDALTRNLSLNGYDITGSGDINISGIVNATRFVGDGSGLTNLNTLDVIEGGSYSINIIGADSSLIVDRETNSINGNVFGVVTGLLQGDVLGADSSLIVNSATNEVYGKFIGDGSALTNLPISPDGAVVEGSNYRINIVGSDSTMILNSEDGTMTGNIVTSDIKSSESVLTVSNNLTTQPLHIKLESTNSVSTLDFVRNADTAIGEQALSYGLIKFGRNDTNGLKYTSTILASRDQLIFTTNKDSIFDEASSFSWGDEAKFGIGTIDPIAKLDVRGDARVTGSFTVGSYTDIDRPAGVNGMIIYNTTVNKLQGFQNGLWINLDGS